MMRVAGFCPMGCGGTLAVGEGGALFCEAGRCPRPSAAAEILADPEAHHVVAVTGDGWLGKHPLRERLDDELLSCDLADAMIEGVFPPPGLYRVEKVPGGWDWLPQA